jgi:cob(I)alamin adenosyltransferase
MLTRALAPRCFAWRHRARSSFRAAARLLHDGVIANPEVLRYLNRLSDFLFVLARYEEHGHSDPARRARRR